MTDITLMNPATSRVYDPTDFDRLAASLEALAHTFCQHEGSRDGKYQPRGSMDYNRRYDDVALVA